MVVVFCDAPEKTFVPIAEYGLSFPLMARKPDYTTLAHRYTARFPVLTYVGTQTNFWIIANILLIIILELQSDIISQAYNLPDTGSFGMLLVVGIILGLLYGIILGLTGYYLDKKMFARQALGKVIVLKTLTSVGLLILTLLLLKYVFFALGSSLLPMPDVAMNDNFWRLLFYLLLIYYSFMTLVINFINQINKKYGPGVLLPLLLGRFRDPKEEDRIFMFMDLRSSTSTAEQLGHLRYSAFIRDCFSDINEVIYPYSAQVYQYVGDEIVVTWPESEGLKDQCCIGFYFACKKKFQERSNYYLKNYGLLPDFKAGAHAGTVTIVEIGEVKKDIAYHGDTLNTAARIQGICNDHGKSLLVSDLLLEKLGRHARMKTQPLGLVQLKGKAARVGVVSVDDFDLKPAL
jgi:adenylate cyclase